MFLAILQKILTFDILWILLKLNYSKSNKTSSDIHYNHSDDKSLSQENSSKILTLWRIDVHIAIINL